MITENRKNTRLAYKMCCGLVFTVPVTYYTFIHMHVYTENAGRMSVAVRQTENCKKKNKTIYRCCSNTRGVSIICLCDGHRLRNV